MKAPGMPELLAETVGYQIKQLQFPEEICEPQREDCSVLRFYIERYLQIQHCHPALQNTHSQLGEKDKTKLEGKRMFINN